MKLYDAKQMSELMGVSIRTVREWSKKGEIGSVQPHGKGGRVKYYFYEEPKRENR